MKPHTTKRTWSKFTLSIDPWLYTNVVIRNVGYTSFCILLLWSVNLVVLMNMLRSRFVIFDSKNLFSLFKVGFLITFKLSPTIILGWCMVWLVLTLVINQWINGMLMFNFVFAFYPQKTLWVLTHGSWMVNGINHKPWLWSLTPKGSVQSNQWPTQLRGERSHICLEANWAKL